MSNSPSEKHKIITCQELLQENLTIPIYQRPYRWKTETALTLFNDIYSAYKEKIPEWRIGSVILHKNESNEYNIVDGQQRVTTLNILIYCLGDENISKLLKKGEIFNELSSQSIVNNYRILKQKVDDLQDDDKENFKNYLLKQCTFVKIIADSEQEAFQFFDSQNSRGKELAPHDLLKSYHLREMKDNDEHQKIEIINNWENKDQKNLAIFFENHLYPLVRWYKGKDGLNYSSKKINTFKGIKKENNCNYVIYHKSANLFIEHLNAKIYELTNSEKINQFQLTQPLIAGERFFYYTLYYFNLSEKSGKIVNKNLQNLGLEFKNTGDEAENTGDEAEFKKIGDEYVRSLLINAIMFFIDKFNEEELTKNRIRFFIKWAFSLRLVMQAVYKETINKYALGEHERINNGLNLFEKMSEMKEPEELDTILLDEISKQDLEKYKTEKYRIIWNEFFGVK